MSNVSTLEPFNWNENNSAKRPVTLLAKDTDGGLSKKWGKPPLSRSIRCSKAEMNFLLAARLQIKSQRKMLVKCPILFPCFHFQQKCLFLLFCFWNIAALIGQLSSLETPSPPWWLVHPTARNASRVTWSMHLVKDPSVRLVALYFSCLLSRSFHSGHYNRNGPQRPKKGVQPNKEVDVGQSGSVNWAKAKRIQRCCNRQTDLWFCHTVRWLRPGTEKRTAALFSRQNRSVCLD